MRRRLGSKTELEKGHYHVTVEAGINPETGKRARKSAEVYGSDRDAEKAIASLFVSVGKGDKVQEKLTLDDYFHYVFLPNAEGRIQGRTIVGYTSNYNSMIKNKLGGLKLHQITPPVIDKWLASFNSEKRKFEGFKTLRLILRRAIKDRLLDDDPIKHVDAPKHKLADPVVISSKEAAAYIKHSYGNIVEPLILVLIGSGIRVEEFTPLTWGDITQDGDLTIDKATTYYGKQKFEDGTKTDFSDRVIRLPGFVTKRLNEIREGDEVPLMHHPDGSAMTYTNIYNRYKKWIKTLPEGITRTTMQNLRHTSLTLTLEGGAELLTVSRRAGHSNINITATYYLRPNKSIDESAADGLDNLLFG